MSRKGTRNGDGARIDKPANQCQLKQSTRLPDRVKDKLGDRYGRLTVKEFAGFQVDPKSGWNGAVFLCECECGNHINVLTGSLGGHTQSCGCLTRTHGATTSDSPPLLKKAFLSWQRMINRCTNPNWEHFSRYGGRGVAVCTQWRNSFEAFLEDVGLPPSVEHSVDRINNDGDYEPHNVRWATKVTQMNNKSNTRYIKLGNAIRPLTEWCRLLDVDYNAVRRRLRYGWSPLEALFFFPELDEDDRLTLTFVIPPGEEEAAIALAEKYTAKGWNATT